MSILAPLPAIAALLEQYNAYELCSIDIATRNGQSVAVREDCPDLRRRMERDGWTFTTLTEIGE